MLAVKTTTQKEVISLVLQTAISAPSTEVWFENLSLIRRLLNQFSCPWNVHGGKQSVTNSIPPTQIMK